MNMSSQPIKPGEKPDDQTAIVSTVAGDDARSDMDGTSEASPDQADIDIRDKGPNTPGGKASKGRARSERTCLVTRKTGSPDKMVRFVLSPDNIVTPDVNAKLPGRGVWVTAKKSLVAEAVQKNLFQRGFKTQCLCPSDLSEQVEKFLRMFTLGTLGMARASGAAVTGFSKVDSMVRSNEAALVLEATDGSADGLRKIVQAVRALIALGGDAPSVWQVFSSHEMDLAHTHQEKSPAGEAAGGKNVIHLALNRTPAARAALKRVRRMIAYQDLQPVDVSPKKGSNTPNSGAKPQKAASRPIRTES